LTGYNANNIHMNGDIPTYRADERELLQYREFWEENLQKIQEISKILEKQLYRLEEKHTGFEDAYESLISKINLLLSIYSHYDSIEGIDYLLKLKSMLEQYKRRSLDTIDFSALYHIHAKVIEFRERSFDRFPELIHTKKARTGVRPASDKEYQLPFRWITFSRNRSWFIHPFSSYSVHQVTDMEYAQQKTSHYFSVTVQGKTIEAIDLFSGDSGLPTSGIILIIQSGDIEKAYFADSIGKKILARKDVIGNSLRPSRHPEFSPGWVRLFGKNHIYINTGSHRPFRENTMT